jgi:hypothetical protein
VERLTGEGIGGRDAGEAVRAALYARRIGGIVSHDPTSGIVGLASLTEGVVTEIVEAIPHSSLKDSPDGAARV